MTAFVGPVTRVDTKRYGKPTHHYVDANGQRIPGVTTILSEGVPKPALVGWGIKSVAEFAIDNWQDLTALTVSERLKALKGAPYADRDAAANRGTQVHALAEQLVAGQEVDVPEELAGHVESYVRFLDEWDVEPFMVETTVYNLSIGYAGMLDLGAHLRGYPNSLVDVKTNRSGVYGETAFQLAAYRYAEHYIDADGAVFPMPTFDHVFVVHVRADAYELRPIVADERVFLQFRYVAAVARAIEASRGYIGDAVQTSVTA